MKQQPLVDEHVLEHIPDDLIRPLLAISIRASHPQTLQGYQQLLKDIRRLARRCHEAGGESLYYVRVETMILQRLHAMRAAQRWTRQADTTAIGIEVNRWEVEVVSQGQHKTLLVEYAPAGVDPRTLEERVRAIVTEIPPRSRYDPA